MRGIVETIFIHDERFRQRTDFQQAVPITRISSEARDLQAHDQADAAQPHIRHEALEAIAFGGGGPGETLILIDDLNAIGCPPERLRPTANIVLTDRAFSVIKHLSE
jgi:hypothetical protein